MVSQTSAPDSARGLLRQSKNEMMRQWRNRSVLTRLLPALSWLLVGLLFLFDGILLLGAVARFGGFDQCLPASVRTILQGPASPGVSRAGTSTVWAKVSDCLPNSVGVSPLRLAGTSALLAACLLALARLTRRALPMLSAGLYGLSWPVILACLFAVGFEIFLQVSTGGDWLTEVVLLTIALAVVGELISRHGWAALAGTFVAGLAMAAGGWFHRADVVGWGAWLGLLCFSLAAHAARPHLFGRNSTLEQPAGKSTRKCYRKPARSRY